MLPEFWKNVYCELLLFFKQKSDMTMVPSGSSFEVSRIDKTDHAHLLKLWNEHGVQLLTKLESRVCPACGEGDGVFVFTTRDGYNYHNCPACGCCYFPKMLQFNVFEQFFDLCPEASLVHKKVTQNRISGLDDSSVARFDNYLNWLSPFLERLQNSNSSYPNVLDFGTGLGGFLHYTQSKGFNSTGIELDSVTAQVGREKGLTIFSQMEELPRKKFELISLWEVVEHLDSPHDYLHKLKELLALNGLLVFTFPNLNSLDVRVYGSDTIHVYGGDTGSGHINLFNFNNFKILLNSAGLVPIASTGEFSTNLLDLFMYIQGVSEKQIKGNTLDDIKGKISTSTLSTLNAIGPLAHIMQLETGTAPILFVVACKEEDRPFYSGAIGQFSELISNERQAILKKAKDSWTKSIPKYKWAFWK
nr:class I SAM-dependent methyltransferase [Pseudodesulfovibrio sp.]